MHITKKCEGNGSGAELVEGRGRLGHVLLEGIALVCVTRRCDDRVQEWLECDFAAQIVWDLCNLKCPQLTRMTSCDGFVQAHNLRRPPLLEDRIELSHTSLQPRTHTVATTVLALSAVDLGGSAGRQSDAQQSVSCVGPVHPPCTQRTPAHSDPVGSCMSASLA
jgi:hypothetical protein